MKDSQSIADLSHQSDSFDQSFGTFQTGWKCLLGRNNVRKTRRHSSTFMIVLLI